MSKYSTEKADIIGKQEMKYTACEHFTNSSSINILLLGKYVN